MLGDIPLHRGSHTAQWKGAGMLEPLREQPVPRYRLNSSTGSPPAQIQALEADDGCRSGLLAVVASINCFVQLTGLSGFSRNEVSDGTDRCQAKVVK